METPIEKAVRVLGGPGALAKAADVSPQAVSQWLKGRRPVPAERAPLIELATRAAGHAVTADELCPSVPWNILRGSKLSKAAAA